MTKQTSDAQDIHDHIKSSLREAEALKYASRDIYIQQYFNEGLTWPIYDGVSAYVNIAYEIEQRGCYD